VRRLDRTDHAAVDRAMEVLAIADLAGRQLHELSGGQRQRVLVA
jgi:zinc/manganese transport system ATP-binding protein